MNWDPLANDYWSIQKYMSIRILQVSLTVILEHAEMWNWFALNSLRIRDATFGRTKAIECFRRTSKWETLSVSLAPLHKHFTSQAALWPEFSPPEVWSFGIREPADGAIFRCSHNILNIITFRIILIIFYHGRKISNFSVTMPWPQLASCAESFEFFVCIGTVTWACAQTCKLFWG